MYEESSNECQGRDKTRKKFSHKGTKLQTQRTQEKSFSIVILSSL